MEFTRSAITAEDYEAAPIRERFGPDVSSVVLYDREDGGGFCTAVALDADGGVLGSVTDRRDPLLGHLNTVAAERGRTVKFTLEVEPAEPDDEGVDDA